MKVGVLSGKGGTGKTFISTNLAWAIKDSYYIDCDVEEPNGHLFIKPENIEKKPVYINIPKLNKDLCINCGECIDNCNFNAIANIGKYPMIFKDICHSCNACIKLCKQNALEIERHNIGNIHTGKRQDTNILSGIMNIGESLGTSIIEDLINYIKVKEDVIVDCPPGTDCLVMDSIKDLDYCIIVLEPNIFGLENFKMVRELVELFKKPYGVIINKSYSSDNIAARYCRDNDIDIIMEIPYSEEIGRYNSKGLLITEENLVYNEIFKELYRNIKGRQSI